MNKYLSKLLLFNVHSAEGEQEINFKASFLNSVFLLAGVVAFGMGFIRWQKSAVMGLIDFVFSGLCFALLYYLRLHKEKIKLVSSVALILSFMLFFAIYLLAPYNTTRMSLFFLLSASAIFLKGRKIGFYWLTFILLSLVVGYLIPHFDTAYSHIDILTTCVYLIALYIIFSNYEAVKETQAELLEQHRNRLEADVAQRTAELREANRLLEGELAERKKAKEQIRILAGLIEIAPASITVHDLDGNFLYVNQTSFDLHGYSKEEYLAINLQELDVPESKLLFASRIQQLMENKTVSFEVGHFRKDHTILPLMAHAKLAEWGGKKVVLSIAFDITERKKADELKQNILDAIDEGFIIIDRDFRILSANRAYSEQVKMPLEEIINRHCYELSHHLTRPCAEAEHPCSVRQVFDTGEPAAAVHTHYDNAGKPLYVETKSYALSKDAAGNVITVIETITDITEQRRNAEEIMKARNLQSLGILAGGIAHDFNNLLQGLLGNISMARTFTPETSKAFSFLKSAEEAYSSAHGLTSQLLAFSTGGAPVRETIRPNGLIRDMITFTLSGSNVKAVFDLDTNLRSINVDPDQLRQVIGNMVLNARDAMPTGGQLTVRTENVSVHPDDMPGLSPGPYVRISVKDSGQGIAQEIFPRIFDPYFSTKERGTQKGMGLGLTICDTIIRKHGGVIAVESAVDEGATFHIYLPATAVETVLPKPVEITGVAKEGVRILIMDDEPAVYQVAKDYLGLLGYRADAVRDGEAAINAYQAALQEGDPYAALILDLTIPGGMGGQEAMKRISKIDPGVTAIVSSGYADDQVITDFAAYGFKKSLVKPYPLEILKDTLDQIL